MDKNLIFRLRECAKASSAWIGDSLNDIADRLERIDAERGKEAVAWFLNSSPAGTAPFYEQVAKQYEGDTDTFPLFLSPTIPECWAPLPDDPTGEMLLVLQDAIHGGYDDERGLYAAIRAAAQGERNAD